MTTTYKQREQESLDRFIHRMLIHSKGSRSNLNVNFDGTIFTITQKDTIDTALAKYWKKKKF